MSGVVGDVQTKGFNPYAVGNRPPAPQRESSGLGDDQPTVSTDGTAGAAEAAESQDLTSPIGVIRTARAQMEGILAPFATHAMTAGDAPKTLEDTQATVADAEAAYAAISPDSPEYAEATQIMLELELSAVGIARQAIDTMNAGNLPEVNQEIAQAAGNIILQANNFKAQVNTAYFSSSALSTLDLESSNAAFALVCRMEELGMEIDPLLADLANCSPDSAQSSDEEGAVAAGDMFGVTIANQAYQTLTDIMDKIRDAYRQDSQDDDVLAAKLAEKRLDEARTMQKKLQEKLIQLIAMMHSIMNDASLDPESARAKLGVLLAEVEAARSQFAQIRDQLPPLVAQQIDDELTSTHDQLVDALNGVGVAVLDQELQAANEALQQRMADLGIQVEVA